MLLLIRGFNFEAKFDYDNVVSLKVVNTSELYQDCKRKEYSLLDRLAVRFGKVRPSDKKKTTLIVYTQKSEDFGVSKVVIYDLFEELLDDDKLSKVSRKLFELVTKCREERRDACIVDCKEVKRWLALPSFNQ